LDLLATSDFTEQEAREAVDDIKKGINSVRARIYDLNQRRGWKALGYRSFTSCCMQEFPELHERTIRKQLHAAQIEETLKRELGPKGPKNIGDTPETHLRPLVSVKDDDETLVAAYSKAKDIAKEQNQGKLTEAIVTRAVQDVSAKPGDNAWSASELERKKLVLAGKTVVANMHKDSDIALIKWAKENNKFVSIDRKTDWGNPFVMDTSISKQDGDRDKVCDSYELFFQLKLSLQVRINALKGCVLGCWCYPNRCHGNFLAEKVNNHEN
jgi:hypothetical protein